MSDPWRVKLLGGLRAERGEQVITRFKTQKVAALFAYLAFHLRQAHAREVLIELLWPESDAPTLRNSLSVALSSLRNQFEPPGVPQGTMLRADRFSISLNPAVVTTDVAEFERALKAATRAGSVLERAQHLSEAVELYQGPLLLGFYEDWVPTQQERLAGLFLDAVGALVTHLENTGDTRTALAHARHAVAVDPLREEGQQHLIRLLAADRQPGAALRQYKEYERLLEEEIGDEPSPALRALFRRIEKESGLSPPALAAPIQPRPASATASPAGPATVTFLLTDIEGSARLFQQTPEAYSAARERHHVLLRREFSRHDGQEVKETADGFIVAFPTAGSALACAVSAQQALAAEGWPPPIGGLRVRMALHTGDVQPSSGEDGQYHGIVLHHASRMLTAAHGGQLLASDTTAGLLQQARMEEGLRLVDLGVYRLRDLAEARRLYQVEYPGMPPHDFGPLAAEAGHRANVPPRFTRFFGREQEIEQLGELLLSPLRLVTVTGPGGTGKTRLSLEVAERLAGPFEGAVYYVPLADLADPTLIAGAVLDGLGVARAPQQEPVEQVVETLSRRPTLLVLDNFEQLVDGGAGIVQILLTRVPSLKLLVTSRRLLGLTAEREFVLSPLPVPGTEDTPERLCLYESVQLFIDRAQQVMPHFQVSNANAPAVAALVAGLEGIPLAIELAAARVQVLTPAQMLAQLKHRLDFLSSRKRDVVERQRTLRGAMEWSYRLLAPELQRFFSRLSVFRGAWSVEAAEVVCEEPLALDYLEQLRECSLVLSSETQAGAFRFRMLETLRECGLEQMTPEDRDATKRRHAEFFVALADAARPHLSGLDQAIWMDRLETEHDNLRAAFDRLLERDASATLRLVASLGSFWLVRGRRTEGIARAEQALQRTRGARTEERARALYQTSRLYWGAGDNAAAAAVAEEAVEICRERGDRLGVARSLLALGWGYYSLREIGRCEEVWLEALQIAREDGDPAVLAGATMAVGCNWLYHRQDFERAAPLLLESVEQFRRLGSKWSLGHALGNRAELAWRLGDLEAAEAAWEESTRLWLEIGDRGWAARTSGRLAQARYARGDREGARSALEQRLACAQEAEDDGSTARAQIGLAAIEAGEGRIAEARTLLKMALQRCQEARDEDGVITDIECAAAMIFAAGDAEAAARLWGAAESLARARDLLPRARDPLSRGPVNWLHREMAAARAALGELAYATALEEGRNLTREEGLALALIALER